MGALSYNSSSSASSTHTNSSYHTQSTAPTSRSTHRPSFRHFDSSPPNFGYLAESPKEYGDDLDRRASVITYASTVPSEEDLHEKPRYQLPSERYKTFSSDAVPSTPPEFAQLFPSTRRLLIRHDDSTSDGNMNLRVDTEVPTSRSRKVKMTLFHLRMLDLDERKFSLRRYCRDSGREVCHSAKKYNKPRPVSSRPRRPTLQRSLTSALQTLSIGKRSPPKREDSGYESDDDAEDELHRFTSASQLQPTIPTNSIKLEFANYAQVEVHRHRGRLEKSYDFEYWGSEYQWSRSANRDHNPQRPYYYLTDLTKGVIVAQITPDRIPKAELLEEEYQGAWVPPCRMEITDRSISDEVKADLADVIVATGLIALTDDCIKQRWHSGKSVRMSMPRAGTQGYVEPAQLIDEVFNRQSSKPRIHQHRSKA